MGKIKHSIISTATFNTIRQVLKWSIVCIGVPNPFPPQKHHPLFFAKHPLKSANCPALDHFQTIPSKYWFFTSPHPLLKIGFFSKLQYSNFLSLTPCHLLKVTNFLVKILSLKSQLGQIKTFLFKLFQSLSISDISLFFM